ncbi:MAG: hypothetical protein RJQ07_04480 [Pseudomonadales bacterium]
MEWTVDPGFGFAAAKPTLPQPPLNMVLGGFINASRVAAGIFFFLCWFTLFEEFVLPREVVRSSGYTALSTFVMVGVIFFWFTLDARQKAVTPSRVLKFFVVLVPMIAIPYYKIRHFGWLPAIRFLSVFLTMLVVPPILLALSLNIGIGLE